MNQSDIFYPTSFSNPIELVAAQSSSLAANAARGTVKGLSDKQILLIAMIVAIALVFLYFLHSENQKEEQT
jgi:hypothetical protein